MELENFISIEDVTIKSELIELSKKTKFNSIYKSNLIDCNVVLDPKGMPSSRFGSRFTFRKSMLDHCVVRAKGRVHKFEVAESVIFKNCKFIGAPFTEAVFGSGKLSNSKNVELLHACDFSECDLRDARFYSTSVEQLKLPSWPHITIVARDKDQVYAWPSKKYPGCTTLRDDVRSFDWCYREFGEVFEAFILSAGNDLHTPTIVVHHADEIRKLGGGTLEAIKDELDRFAHPAIRY